MIDLRVWAWMVFSATFSAAMLFVLAVCEYGVPIYIPLWIYGLFILFCYFVLFGASKERRGAAPFAFPLLFTFGLIFVLSDSQDSSQAMMRALHRVKPGMNIAQVEAIMSGYNRYNQMFGFQNTKRLPSGELALIHPDFASYKHSMPNDGAYNAASGVVYFKDGKATSVEYRGD
ncbi:MAG TPA: hypothetical protein VF627_12305 [Abditibacterium sp.]|jgi:hypothetical protein